MKTASTRQAIAATAGDTAAAIAARIGCPGTWCIRRRAATSEPEPGGSCSIRTTPAKAPIAFSTSSVARNAAWLPDLPGPATIHLELLCFAGPDSTHSRLDAFVQVEYENLSFVKTADLYRASYDVVLRDLDGYLYVRHYRGRLVVGAFEPKGKPKPPERNSAPSTNKESLPACSQLKGQAVVLERALPEGARLRIDTPARLLGARSKGASLTPDESY